jgi:hypothetical protein
MDVIFIGVAAFVGAMVAALLGWTESGEGFDARKFSSSIIRAIIGGVGIAAAWDYVGSITPIAYLLAFLAGVGVDAGGNRIAGAIAARVKKNE